MPSHIYKFLRTEHLDLVLGGSVRLSRDSVFREMEQKEAAWIGDRLENVSEAVFEGGLYSAELVNATAPSSRVPLIAVAPGSKVRMHDVGFQYQGAPFYMYSAACGDLTRLTKVMCDEAPPADRRDSCVEILNFPKLANIIFQFGRVEIKNRPYRMRDLFSDVKHGRVVYLDMAVKAGVSMAETSPFNKHIMFRPQSEVRIAFTPRNVELPSTLNVSIDKPNRFFSEIFRGRASALS